MKNIFHSRPGRLAVVLSILFLGTLLTTGCGINGTGYNYNNQENRTVVNLNGKNFRVVKSVEASQSATYVLGIGGLTKNNLKNNAVAEMYRNANLTGSQTIINVNVTQSVAFYVVFHKVNVKAYGTVIEFTE